MILNQFLFCCLLFTQTKEKRKRNSFLVVTPTSLGFLYMDRVFNLTVHNFYLCFCSSLISLHSLRHISSQSICGTKPKRPILPASATGGRVSPRWNGVATLCLGAFLRVASQIWIQGWGSQGFWDQNWSFCFPNFFPRLSFASHLSDVSETGSQPLPSP